MLYDYQYDIAAIGISFLVLIVINLRKTYRTRSLRLFVILVNCNLIAAIFDAISCFTISYPDSCPIWLNYIISLGYLFFYNSMSILYFLYIESKAEIKRIRPLANASSIFFACFFFIVIASSPWTHWVSYFTSDGVYQHGPLMDILYIIPFIYFIAEFVIFIVARKQFNRYQLSASIGLIISMGISVLISIIWPRMLIGQLTMAVIMFFVYMSYENPAHYTYKSSQCYNRSAFGNSLAESKRLGHKIGLVGVCLQDYNFVRNKRGEKLVDKTTTKIADFLYHQFKNNAFAIADDKYVVVLEEGKSPAKIHQLLEEYFVFPISVNNDSIKYQVRILDILTIDLSHSVEDIESYIECRLDYPDSEEKVAELLEGRRQKEAILHCIKTGLDKRTFEVYYQPIYDVRTKSFRSAEALLRLKDEELGFINPEQLVTIAEDNGLIDQIGDLVFRKVCSFMRATQIQNLGANYIEINLSPKQCTQPDLVPRFQSAMKVYKIDPSSINLEITETAEMAENQAWLENIQKLHAIGVEFSIDDFGSGFASNDYLIKFPVSIVKIDKGILWQAMENPQAMIVLTNTIRMLKELGKEIVVEGVENEEMVQFLIESGVDFLQGYYYSRPIPPEEYVEFLKSHNS